MRNKRIIKKAATLLLVLLMLGSLFGVAVSEGTSADDLTSLPDDAYGATDPDYRISDSPYLRLPDDMKDWPPMVPSEPREVGEVKDPTAVEIYNAATGEVIRIPSNDTTQQPVDSGIDSIPPYQGLLPPGFVLESVLPPDGRSRITTTATYPWRTVCKLFLTFPDGATGGCSGAIIGCPDGHGYHVLTAGHCVYSHSHGGWATSVKFVPGLDDDYMPYNYAWATFLRSYTGWTSSGMSEHDWAVVTLDRNVGDHTGWMGRQTAGPSSSIYTGTKNIAGYPGDKPDGTMWFDADSAHSTDEHNYWYYMDTYAGMSGGPVWRYTGTSRYILATHTCGTGGCGIAGKGVNHGTRLNSDKFDRIITWCNADTPPTDKADLIDDGQLYSDFNPTTVKPGTTSFHGWCDVRNIGTASSGGFYVSYYASTNTYISTSDYLIGTDYVSSISPFNWKDSDWTGTFPSGVPDGNYYVGWIIDSGGHVTEFDETNNVAYKSSPKLLVDGTQPSASISINSGATYTTTTPVTLGLTYSDGGSGVDKCRYGNYGEPWTSWQTCTATKSWTLSSGDGTKTVYYQVRDKVGNIRQVYDSIVLDTTNPPAPIISSSTHPNENNWYCNRNPIFTWTTPSDASGIACYSYTLDHSSSTTPDTTCDTTGNSKSYSGLYGTWYFHVRAKDNAGRWGPADHYRVRIEDCDLKDGCYTYGNGCEDRNYYCSGGSCVYTYTNRHTDYYGGWVNYCSGNTVRKHRQFHDFSCDGGSCKDHTSWKDDQLVENCNDYDGWYCNGDAGEYRDYSCSGGSCTYTVTTTGICGDVNADGTVNLMDVLDVYRRALDPNYPLTLPWAGDVNCDGKINLMDVLDVYRRVLDPQYDLGCCCT